MPAYIRPEDATSPADRWKLIQILSDPGEPGKCVLALGEWDGEPVLALRWNGKEDQPAGSPNSRGHPTWFILPGRYNAAIVSTLPIDMRRIATAKLPE